MDMLLAMTGWQATLCWMMICISGLLMLVVLIQKGRGTGLAGALGGGGGGAVFGAKTGDVFTGITIGLTAVLFIVVIACNFVFDMSGGAPTAVVTPATTTTVPVNVPAGGASTTIGAPGDVPAGTPAGATPMTINTDNPNVTIRQVPVSELPPSGEQTPPAPAEGTVPAEPPAGEPKKDEPKPDDPGTGGGRA